MIPAFPQRFTTGSVEGGSIRNPTPKTGNQWAGLQVRECNEYDPATGLCAHEELTIDHKGGLMGHAFPNNVCKYFHQGRDGPAPRNFRENLAAGLTSMDAVAKELWRQAYANIQAGYPYGGAAIREVAKFERQRQLLESMAPLPTPPVIPMMWLEEPVIEHSVPAPRLENHRPERKSEHQWAGLQVRECNEYDPATGLCAHEELTIDHKGGLLGHAFPNNVCKYFHRGRDGPVPRNFRDNIASGLTSMDAVTKELIRQAYANIQLGMPFTSAAIREVLKFETQRAQGGQQIPPWATIEEPTFVLPMAPVKLPAFQSESVAPYSQDVGGKSTRYIVEDPLNRKAGGSAPDKSKVLDDTTKPQQDPQDVSRWTILHVNECDHYHEATGICVMEEKPVAEGGLKGYPFPENVCLRFHQGRDGLLPRSIAENEEAGLTNREAVARYLRDQASVNIECGKSYEGAAIREVQGSEDINDITPEFNWPPSVSAKLISPATLMGEHIIAAKSEDLPLQPEIVISGNNLDEAFVKKFVSMLGVEIIKCVTEKARFRIWTKDKRGERLRGFDGMFQVLKGKAPEKGLVLEGCTVVVADTSNSNRDSVRFLLHEDTADFILRYRPTAREDISDALLDLPLTSGWKVVVPRHHGDKKSRKYALLWTSEDVKTEDVAEVVSQVPSMSVDVFTPAYGWGTSQLAEFLRAARAQASVWHELQVIVVGGRTGDKAPDITKIPRVLGEDLPRPTNRATTLKFENCEMPDESPRYLLGEMEATLQQVHNRLSGGKLGEVVNETVRVLGPCVLDASIADLPNILMCQQQPDLLADRTRYVVLMTTEETYTSEVPILQMIRGGTLENVLVLIASHAEIENQDESITMFFYDKAAPTKASHRVQCFITTAIGKIFLNVLKEKTHQGKAPIMYVPTPAVPQPVIPNSQFFQPTMMYPPHMAAHGMGYPQPMFSQGALPYGPPPPGYVMCPYPMPAYY
jgi:hypothetical protein